VVALVALTSVATFNKETFFFFVPMLYPILRQSTDRARALTVVGLAALASSAVNVSLRTSFAARPGQAWTFRGLENMPAYLSPGAYADLEYTYGLLGPGGVSFLTMLLVALICARGWPSVRPR
jgi:hypothetical protein